ncbi:hypothetical protein [Actinoplanes sp. NPDC051411]|uniref:hypothetical protein n=1 Tax=Actinoplanes sp. NPDC051411 TaxID=3155522 RepID=UPI00343A5F74
MLDLSRRVYFDDLRPSIEPTLAAAHPVRQRLADEGPAAALISRLRSTPCARSTQ